MIKNQKTPNKLIWQSGFRDPHLALAFVSDFDIRISDLSDLIGGEIWNRR
jgi:hypothetical protein